MSDHELTINGLIPGDGACVVTGCGAAIETGRLMCHRHWRIVPQDIATKVFRQVHRWGRGRGTLGDLRDVQRQAVHAVEAQLEETR